MFSHLLIIYHQSIVHNTIFFPDFNEFTHGDIGKLNKGKIEIYTITEEP